MDFSVFEDAVEVSESQEDEIEKHMHIDAGHVKINDLLDWWKTQEKEFKHLSRIAKHVLLYLPPAELVVQERRTSLSSESVDSSLCLHNNMQ
jgi:hypothetical protein